MNLYTRPATRRSTASRLRRDSEDSLSGAKEDLTKDMPNPPQSLKVEEVTKQLSLQGEQAIVEPSHTALATESEKAFRYYMNSVIRVFYSSRYRSSC